MYNGYFIVVGTLVAINTGVAFTILLVVFVVLLLTRWYRARKQRLNQVGEIRGSRIQSSVRLSLTLPENLFLILFVLPTDFSAFISACLVAQW